MSNLVLIIDDSLVVRKILEVTLKRAAIDVLSYSDGIEALRALKAQPDCTPALIFLDICLPKMDGYAVARLLRSSPRFDSTVIVMLTQRDGIMDRLKSRLVGATVYLTKPFRTQDVISIVSLYLHPLPTLNGVRRKEIRTRAGDDNILCPSVTTPPYGSQALQMEATSRLA